jgi:amino acid transporter
MPAASTTDDGRRIGLVGATSIGIGGMVGGGIFAVLGVAAEQAGGATPISFLVAGTVACLTGYSYSKLSVAHPDAGGTVSFIDRAFGINDLTGSLNAVLWAGYIATTALYASAFANYAATLLPGGKDPTALLLRVLIAVAIGIPWLINLVSAGAVGKSEGVIVVIKMLILLVVVVAGVPSVDTEALQPGTWPSALTIIASGMLIFVAYEGFELIANAAEDVRRPRFTLPRAFAFSLGIVVVLYVAISIVVIGSLTPSQITASADFALAEAASASLGQVGFVMVAVSAVLATLSAINATLYGAARLSYTIATEGELPAAAAGRLWNQPIGLFLTAGAALVIAISLPITSISTLSSAIFLLVFTTVNLAAVRSGPDAGVRKPVAAAAAFGCAISLIVLLVHSGRNDPKAVVALLVALGAALGAEHLYLKGRRPRSDDRR